MDFTQFASSTAWERKIQFVLIVIPVCIPGNHKCISSFFCGLYLLCIWNNIMTRRWYEHFVWWYVRWVECALGCARIENKICFIENMVKRCLQLDHTYIFFLPQHIWIIFGIHLVVLFEKFIYETESRREEKQLATRMITMFMLQVNIRMRWMHEPMDEWRREKKNDEKWKRRELGKNPQECCGESEGKAMNTGRKIIIKSMKYSVA